MADKIRLTTAQALIKFIQNQYINVDGEEFPFVKGVFSIYGHGNVLGIGEALEHYNERLDYFQGKNEQGMGFAAIAYAKQTLRQQIFAVSASAGPGSANLVHVAANAFTNNIPILILPADTFATRQPDPVLQQLEHQHDASLTTNDAFRAVSKFYDRVQRPEQLMSSLVRAFEVMTNPETAGPAVVAISQDVEGEAYDYEASFFEKRVHYIDRKIPTNREIEAALDAIKASKRPVIIAGGGTKYSQAGPELRNISEKYNIPIVETQAGKSVVTYDFPNALGGVGILGTSAANKIVSEADLIIGIGTRYNDFVTSSKTGFDWENQKFVNINVSRFQAYKLDAVTVVADAKVALQKLTEGLEGYQTAYEGEIQEYKAAWNEERERLHNIAFNRKDFDPEIKHHFGQGIMNDYADALGTEFTQTNAFITINDHVDDDAIVVGSAGSLPGDMQRLWNSTEENTFHLEYGYSSMGYEISGTLGVKLAAPNQEVYAMVGDGSFLMLHSELVTAIQENKKINILLFDNSGFGCINNLQMDNGSISAGTEFRTADNEIMNIDYAKIGEGYGLTTYKANTREELIQALEAAKKETNSTLIEMKVLPKTMTDGYESSWWNVGVAEVSKSENVTKAYKARVEKLEEDGREMY
ncbi:3D-(3,5/4)-trihydroxycyclohexane-1,2-dione acylhydrolase (decyclizing) [Suicoccus acidiformans]|uniref:3D-(3,5/4)-trihydroxycyclohexane-1,2-dione acylhydrolase (Decyclizing) n=1 Tax=Suicoccus acidiformans TaxID=2036206 RepID=A0A347WNN8_9LACT|nr:3D-(3,5/4)-trihydroxycyclohexane-1,2-dione acylhydrolase (decyclizing) [Suicoccus acidiformans]AXY26695.1 3D-(3,5/4)-trihydroxycyclohexane-1,2-dione acylhydrolase (decyclizing) [Suicoccus acidiformans]